mmetsp:Transcript_148146/g.369349  ORF Transcript_148146/g.369349 Transcript_148146/m.369349 type:complete len:350 (+) Transcript_148146:84-1133(+)
MGQCLEGVQRPVPKTPKRGFKVCVCGGSGPIGQPLCMLLAMDPRVWELSVQDLAHTIPPPEGMRCDLHHLERKCSVKAYSLLAVQRPVDHLKECLTGCDLVIACAVWPNNAIINSSDLLKLNGSVAKNVIEACAKYCPEAIVGLVVKPLNSVVPAMARLYEKAGLDPMKICGITTLDVVRANKFVHVASEVPIERISVPVVGGHSGPSAVPLFSQDPTAARLSEEQRGEVLQRVQDGGAQILSATKGKCGPNLSQAYACARFAGAVLSGLSGVRTQECCYVKSSACPGLSYFASKVTFGPKGVEQVHPIGKVSPQEQAQIDEVKKGLAEDIESGLKYAETVEFCKGSGE